MQLNSISEAEARNISPALVNTQWKLVKQSVLRGNTLDFSTLTFILQMKRDGSHYGFIFNFPVVLLAVVAVVYFLLRPIELAKYIIGMDPWHQKPLYHLSLSVSEYLSCFAPFLALSLLCLFQKRKQSPHGMCPF